MPIKTLHITNAWHRTSGGINTFYRAILEGAGRRQRQIRIVVPGEKDLVEEVGEFGRIFHVRSPRAPFFDRRYRLLLPHTYLPPFGKRLQKILRTEMPDLVEVCDKYSVSWIAGLLRRGWLPGVERPVLVGMSCERMDDNISAFLSSGSAGKRWSRFYLGQFYIPLFDYHIANSPYTADELCQAMVSRHEREVYVRPMGAEIDILSSLCPSEATRNRLLDQFSHTRPAGKQAKLLLYVGRLSPEKNIELLIETLIRLSSVEGEDFRLLIAGSGPMAEEFDRIAQVRVPGRINVLGHLINRNELADVYANCDAFLHPNPREPFGIAPLEALAAGLPLIAPKSGGVLSYADETNSWLARPDAESFAQAVLEVFASPGIRKAKMARARSTAEQLSWERVTGEFFELYDELYKAFPSSRFARKSDSRAKMDIAHEKL